ncbi:hypothetical protein SLEP1_g45004 [Rubroshorea leprosula]|uniref:DUF4220 domain-containing protein n=1 Tax=Rubroshorea leprosula TaxID=152421 RepID=A0AAV5LHQ9_9ROSI|nr:hypothetical protein SLEP1_g45004 [Rubroshorea leprosula]
MDSSPTEGSNMEKLDLEEHLKRKNVIEEGKYIHRAFLVYKIYKPLFSDLKLRIHKKLRKIFIIPSLTLEDVSMRRPLRTVGNAFVENAFKMIHTELGFLYDVLFTKTTILQSVVGIILRSICFLSTFAALVAFSMVVGKSDYHRLDISITYLLLGGAIFLDIYSAMSHAFSYWTLYWLTIPSKWVDKLVGRSIVSWLVVRRAGKKEMISMAQHSLIDYCIKAQESCWTRILRVLDNEGILEKFWWTSWKPVNLDLKKFIYLHLQGKFERYRSERKTDNGTIENKVCDVFDHKLLSDILKERGDHTLQRYRTLLEVEFKWSTTEIEFGHSILVWHIATYLLFNDDKKGDSGSVPGSNCQISMLLSDYMMYLLLVRPQMLPKGIGEVRIRDTRDQIIRFFNRKKSLTPNDATSALLGIKTDETGIQEFSRSKSVMFEGCKLAFMLQEFEGEWEGDLEKKWQRNPEKKWKMMAEVWMEMLTFAANRCEWKEHATHLRNGGELLTHIALLMAHLGLTEHIQVVESGRFTSDPHLDWNWDQLSDLANYLA